MGLNKLSSIDIDDQIQETDDSFSKIKKTINCDRTIKIGEKIFSKLLGKSLVVTKKLYGVTRCDSCAYREFCVGKHQEFVSIRLKEVGNCSAARRDDGIPVFFKEVDRKYEIDSDLLNDLSFILKGAKTKEDILDSVNGAISILNLYSETKET